MAAFWGSVSANPFSTPLKRSQLATPLAWYKCQNSQNAQKCLGRVRKVFLGLRSESPKTVSCTVRNCLLGCFARCETRFARCERLFWDSRPRETKSLLALSLKHFGHFGCFDTCTRPAGLKRLQPQPQRFAQNSGAVSFAKTFTCYRVHLGPSGPKLEKESESEFLGPWGPKSRKRSRKRVKMLKNNRFGSFSTPFWTFWGPAPRGPGNSFSDSFSNFWARRAHMTPVASPRNPKLSFAFLVGRCERVLNFMGRKVTRRQQCRMKAFK